MVSLRMPSATRVSAVVAGMLLLAATFGGVASAHAADFDPTLIISNDNMRAADSMTVKEIQAFLETQPGPLAKLVTADYDKVITTSTKQPNVNLTPDKGEAPKPASQIIWEACRQWQISPKVMLAMLQKEQSLLTRTTLATNTMSRAIGAGCPNTTTNHFPGFGNQMWHGARLLSIYGEGHVAFPTYYEGIKKTIYRHASYGTSIQPKNLATFKLYVYNPSIPGNTNFYNIYSRYFGSPLTNPRMRPVYRFKHRNNGTYLYTSSIAEQHRLRQSTKYWLYGGIAFSTDTSIASTATVPVYRFKNKARGTYSFTSSKKAYTSRRTSTGRRTWAYQGIAYRVARTKSPGSVSVHQFKNRRTNARLLTSSAATIRRLKSDRRTWAYLGEAYYLPRAQETTTPPVTQEPTTTPQ